MMPISDERIDDIAGAVDAVTVLASSWERDRVFARAIESELARQAEPVAPSGYAYRYPDGLRFNNGREVNGSKPTEVLPYWFAPPLPSAPDTVQVPRTKEEAEMMVRLGSMFLEAAPKSTP